MVCSTEMPYTGLLMGCVSGSAVFLPGSSRSVLSHTLIPMLFLLPWSLISGLKMSVEKWREDSTSLALGVPYSHMFSSTFRPLRGFGFDLGHGLQDLDIHVLLESWLADWPNESSRVRITEQQERNGKLRV